MRKRPHAAPPTVRPSGAGGAQILAHEPRIQPDQQAGDVLRGLVRRPVQPRAHDGVAALAQKQADVLPLVVAAVAEHAGIEIGVNRGKVEEPLGKLLVGRGIHQDEKFALLHVQTPEHGGEALLVPPHASHQMRFQHGEQLVFDILQHVALASVVLVERGAVDLRLGAQLVDGDLVQGLRFQKPDERFLQKGLAQPDALVLHGYSFPRNQLIPLFCRPCNIIARPCSQLHNSK